MLPGRKGAFGCKASSGAIASRHIAIASSSAGETTLLGEFALLARERGLRARRMDARALPLTPSLLEAELRVPADVLLIDELQALAPLEPWLRTELFPSFPSALRVVTARREPMSTEWRADAGFRELITTVELDVLQKDECEDYLSRCGVACDAREEILTFASGLPLALSLATDAASTRAPEGERALVGTLLGRLLCDVPPGPRRRALEIAALNRVVTPALLRALLGEADESDALFVWLEQRPFTRLTREGLVIHDVLRGAIFRDLALRDEARRRAIVDRSMDHYLSQHVGRHPSEYRSALRSVLDLLGNESALALDELGISKLRADALRDEDRGPILEAIATVGNEHERPLAARYMDLEHKGAVVGRASDGTPGAFLQFIELPSDRFHDDPVVAAFTRWIEEHAPLGPKDRAILCRFRVLMGDLSAFDSFIMVEMVPRLFAAEGVVVGAVAIPSDDYPNYPEHEYHTRMGEVESGGARLTLVGHDVRAHTIHPASQKSALARLAFIRNGVGTSPDGSTQPPAWTPRSITHARNAGVRPLPREELEAEVRYALKNFNRRDRLARSALLGASFLGGQHSVDALRESIERACRSLGDRGGDALHAQILMATYIADRRKQLAVAQDLGMSYSSLRRHLADATRRVVDVLWELERKTYPSMSTSFHE